MFRYGLRKAPMINIQMYSHMQVEKGTKEFQTKAPIAMLRDFPVESRYVLKKASFMKTPLLCAVRYLSTGIAPSFQFLLAKR